MGRTLATVGAVLLLVAASLQVTSASINVRGTQVPTMDEFNALVAQVHALEQRVAALEASPWPTSSPAPSTAASPSPSPLPTTSTPPSPSPSPSPAPSPSSTPTATPSPTGCTTQAPAPTGSDQTTAIQSALNSTANGGTLCLQPGTYRIDGRLNVSGKTNVTIDGRTATLDAVTHPTDCELDMLRITGSTGTKVRNVTLRGSHPSPGTYVPGCEWQHNIYVAGSTSTEIGPSVTLDDAQGDCIYIRETSVISDGLWFHDAICSDNGRMGLAVIGARNVLVERVTWTNMAYAAVDLEPNADTPTQGAYGFEMRNTTMTGKPANKGGSVWFSAGGFGRISNVNVHDNNVTSPWGLYVGTCCSGPRMADITLRANTATTGTTYGQGSPMYFRDVDRLTVTGNNVGTGVSQKCVTAVNSTAVSVSGNTGCNPQT